MFNNLFPKIVGRHDKARLSMLCMLDNRLTNTHPEHVILTVFNCNSVCTNEFYCYVVHICMSCFPCCALQLRKRIKTSASASGADVPDLISQRREHEACALRTNSNLILT
jgi:hypothetical protein